MKPNYLCNASPCKVSAYCSLLIAILAAIIAPFGFFSESRALSGCRPEERSPFEVMRDSYVAMRDESFIYDVDAVFDFLTDIAIASNWDEDIPSTTWGWRIDREENMVIVVLNLDYSEEAIEAFRRDVLDSPVISFRPPRPWPFIQVTCLAVSPSVLAEPIETLSFLEDTVTMAVVDITYLGIHLSITNESELEIYFWGNFPSYMYYGSFHHSSRLYYRISLDYFDGENWRNIPRPERFSPPWYQVNGGRIDPFFNEIRIMQRFDVMPSSTVLYEAHLLNWMDCDCHCMSEPGERLFRIRKDVLVHQDRNHSHQDLLNQYLQAVEINPHSIDPSSPLFSPITYAFRYFLASNPRFIVRSHTLVAEFYWDGQIPAAPLSGGGCDDNQ